MAIKKNKLIKKPIERIYKDGREAILLSQQRRKKTTRNSIQNKIYPYAPPTITHPLNLDKYDLPSSYNVTRLVLIAKDPHWIYAYWEISNDTLDGVKKELGGSLEGCRYILRFYDVTYKIFDGTNANYWFDIEVGPHTNNWYVNLWKENASYCADLAIITNAGKFIPLARSNFVQTPPLSQDNTKEPVWMDLGDELRKNLTCNPHQREIIQRDSKTTHSNMGRKIYLTEDDIRIYYSEISPLLRKLLFSRYRRKIFKLPSRDRDGVDLSKLFSLYKGKFVKKILLGSSEMMLEMGGASEQHIAASESSQKERKFFFEIGTELIVYGRTQPGAEVWLGNKRINLRNDGTFNLRFALPDGKLPLNFTAASNDKLEIRKISTEVVKTTPGKSR